MNQTLFDYAQDRKEAKRKLGTLYGYIKYLMEERPEFREIKERNALIRYVWDNHNPYENSESITRIQRKVIEENPHLDTEKNVKLRGNRETSYHQYFNPKA